MARSIWLSTLALVACGPSIPETDPNHPQLTSVTQPAGPVGAGVVVWESDRSGDWRLWRADLQGGGAAQLTPDERGRKHCCAHISPDGRRIVYLSLSGGGRKYLDEDALGELWLAPLEGSDSPPRKLVDGARTYFEHRAAVWSSTDELHYIAGDGSVRSLNVNRGDETVVLESSGDLARRWLVDPSGRWAASGQGALARVEKGRLGRETPLPGCQPYFSHDGRWGFWTAGGGGPIDRFELATGEASTLLEKNDARLPEDRGYLYFPMLSRDGTLFAFAASPGEHDHHRADYDVFVGEIDPETLELIGEPWPVAPDPAVDRFPDVWRSPLELGRVVGEVPLEVSIAGPDGASWRWLLAGEELGGPKLEMTLEDPGVFPVQGEADGVIVHGVVVAEEPEAVVPMRETWPGNPRGVLWHWSATTHVATTSLERGRETVDLSRPLELSLGSVVAADTAELLLNGLQRTNRLGLEVVLSSLEDSPDDRLSAIVAVGRSRTRENFVLAQRGSRLVLRMRVGPKGPGAYDETDLGPVAPGRRLHLAFAYSPGRLTVYRDGEEVLRKRDLIGHFFQWRAYPLSLGDRFAGGAEWSGRVEAVAVYDRLLAVEEMAVNFRLLGF